MKLRIAFLFFLLAFCASASFAQIAPATCTASPNLCLTQTTLTNSVGAGPTLYSGTTTPYQTVITIGATTNLVQSLNQIPQSVIYIDREAMAVMSFNSTTLQVTVIRGFYSTQVLPHAAGSMVLLGNLNQFSTNTYSNAGAIGTQYGSNCITANTISSPYLDVQNGLQWLCSTVSQTWVPGFGNDVLLPGLTTSVAVVAGTTVPSGPYFHLTGSGAIVNFGIPLGCNANAVAANPGQCQFTAISDAGFTWTAAGNISIAGTGTIGHIFTFTWDSLNAKWVPSALA